MALIIEDGTGKADAQAYVDEAGARDYAALRGITLPADDNVVAALLLDATDYLEAFRSEYQGWKTWPNATTDPVHVAQGLQWPRTGVYIDGNEVEFPGDAIPVELVKAQCQLVIEGFNGVKYNASTDGRVVKRKKVDVLETEYMTGAEMGTGAPPAVSMPKVDALLAPLLDGSGGFGVTTVRV